MTPPHAQPSHLRPAPPAAVSDETRMAMGLYLEGASELARVRLLQERLPGQVVLEALAGGPLTVGELRERTGMTREQASRAMLYYSRGGLVIREGEPGAYVYRLPGEGDDPTRTVKRPDS